MNELIMWTLYWVPEGPRVFVLDLMLGWACEEAGRAYSVRTIPFEGRKTNHLSQLPFGQVPFLSEGELDMFESGAGLLHLARKSEKLMPRDAVGEAETVQWIIAALNSIEMVTVPWWFLEISGAKDNGLRSEEHTSELQSLMRISYAVFCLKKKRNKSTSQHIDER